MVEMKSPAVKEKPTDYIVETVNEVSPPASTPLRSQPKITCDRPVTHRLLSYGQTLLFELTFKIYQPFGYNLADVIGAEIMFKPSEEKKKQNKENEKQYYRLDLPSTYVFIKSASKPPIILSREATISPAISVISNDSVNTNRFASKARVI